jgi:hypothetical protein
MSVYYAMIDGERRGPFELQQLVKVGVRPSTYVWCKGMADWEKAEDVADICRLYRNRIFDLMHPSAPPAPDGIKDKPPGGGAGTPPPPPSRMFSRYDPHLPPGEELPSLEEIDSREDVSAPLANIMPWAILSIIFFPPVGLLGVAYASKSKRLWKENRKADAHEFERSAKMCTGIAFFLGLILWSFIIRFL